VPVLPPLVLALVQPQELPEPVLAPPVLALQGLPVPRPESRDVAASGSLRASA
jgi:hypothetical protein